MAKHAWSINRLMKHMRDDHGLSDISGSVKKLQLRNMGYFHGYKGYRFVRTASSEDRLDLTSFSELESIYLFDGHMKTILYPRIMNIETTLKNITLARILEKCSDPSLSTFCKEGLQSCRNEEGEFLNNRMKKNLEVKSTLYGVEKMYLNSLTLSIIFSKTGKLLYGAYLSQSI